MKEEQLDNIFMLVIKPETDWEENTEEGHFTIVPLSEKKHTAVIMDVDEEHHVVELEQFQVYNIPERFNSFKIKNGSLENKSYLVLVKEESK